MLRFLPDSVPEGILRPLLLPDPVAGLYLEDAAPDWRFLFLLVLLPIVLLLRRRTWPVATPQTVALLGMTGTFYCWTFVSGNGRYFAWGLLLVGPLLVLVLSWLPGSRSLRWSALLLVMVVQCVSIQVARTPNLWAMARVTDRALPMQPSPLRERPAVFITISTISYSILVPLFHPESRWANIAGQYNLVPKSTEWSRLRALLASPLPRYLVLPIRETHDVASGRLPPASLISLHSVLHRHDLQVGAGECVPLTSPLSTPVSALQTVEQRSVRGFWLCPLEDRRAGEPEAPKAGLVPDSRTQAALDAVEARCPRFFPPGGGQTALGLEIPMRRYAETDVFLWIDTDGTVLFRYFRAMNATPVGSVDEVLAGNFSLPCDKLPGRYLPFWQRD